jgi:prepilin-type N-terminal cleavage/methylation domain-containing protein/prepilin-type processing-associated H-X9-DG protein
VKAFAKLIENADDASGPGKLFKSHLIENELTINDKMSHKSVISSSTTKKGALGDLPRRLSLTLGGLTPGVKAPKRAFTLIELLVVIAIIAILAAILLPVLARAKAKALTTQDLNNFKQLQMCYQLYLGDNYDLLPVNLSSGGSVTANGLDCWIVGDAQTDTSTTNIMQGKLYDYNQQVAIYLCPANTRMIMASASLPLHPTPYPVPMTRTCSLEYSLGGSTNNGVPITRNGITFGVYTKGNQVRHPASKIAFVDENEYSVGDGCFGNYPANSQENLWWNMAGSRHNKGSVFSFVDGHVEYFKWHGTAVLTYPTTGTPSDWPGDTPWGSTDDLPRVEAGGSELYPVP